MTQTLCHSEVYDSFTYRKGDYSRIYLLFKLLIRIWLVGCLGLSNYSSYYSNSHLLLLVPSNSHLLLFLSNSHWLLFLSNSHLLLFVSFRLLVSLFCVSQCVSLSLLYACESLSTQWLKEQEEHGDYRVAAITLCVSTYIQVGIKTCYTQVFVYAYKWRVYKYMYWLVCMCTCMHVYFYLCVYV